ncbi:hypothetical protein LAZ67_17001066 [Cordylochernes scorpioides]|uniref:ATP-dependent DNA helicase n=1 Tax=Cordylochernes scorpioides TaxID=51811 RepID=A0ABY6LFU6_9ARAC|nr:hypothetical protein LAZ67_17001066 [Cordylochernes scorpioides]
MSPKRALFIVEAIEAKQRRIEQQRQRRLNSPVRERHNEQQRQYRMNMSENQRALQRENSRLRMQRIRQGDNLPLPTGTCFEEDQIPLHFCGQLDQVCPKCRAKYFELEQTTYSKTFHKCCSKGKVELEPIQTSELLESLMTGKHQHSKNFMKNIRSVNSALAFASMGANLAPPPGYGPYCFRINGQIYHRSGALHPENDDQRVFAQLYILDPDEAARQRMIISKNTGCNPDLMKLLSLYIVGINPFADACKMLHEVEKECMQEATANNTEPSIVSLGIIQDRKNDQRRYNAPRSNEVAIIFQNADGEPPLERDLIIHCRSLPNERKTQRISILDPNLEPMVYPILFPYGDQSWTPNLKLSYNPSCVRNVQRAPAANPRTRITQMQYYEYRLSIRDEFNPLLSAGKLTQQYFVDAYDAMAIVRKHGKPDFFVTMTCNPKWLEIVENLEEGQSVENRPDLVVRVFKMKLDVLLEQIKKKDFFGKAIASIRVIEFQKRGLPHAHILIILTPEDKPNTVERIDQFISAEIPDQETRPRLCEIVTRHMVHGPYGEHNLNSPCMVDGHCSKEFPKQFQEETLGHDCANISITEHATLNHDEMKSHMDSRYVSAPEAGWRLFSFPMHQQSHSIMRLQVHLPRQQSICFNEDNIEEVVQQAGNNDTTLTAWFKLNQWTPRQRGAGSTIGRMYSVNIQTDSERFCLRLLLLHISGATPFENLKTFNGIHYQRFKEAAQARSLFEDDKVWDNTLHEAAGEKMPRQLRELFAHICILAVPHNIPDLFSKYKKLLCEDFARLHEGHTSDCQYCTDCVLRDIQNIFTANGKSCRDFDLPVPPDVSDFSVSTYNAEAEKNKADEMRKKIDQNAKQKLAFEAIMSTIDDNSLPQRLFFLDGPGGSGKTFLYKTLLSTIRGNNGIALPVASTGIAANLLEGGRTYHSQFKLPVPLLDTSTSSMRMTSDDAKQIREANVIIYDEATMAPKDALRCINNLLKEIMQNEKPLGGKTIVFGGDFRQTLPVVPHGTQAAIVESSIKFHPLWKKINILKLDNNIRSIDPEFSSWLLKLGNDELTNDLGLDSDTFEIPSERYTDKAILCPRNVDVDDINNRVLDILEGDSIKYFSLDSIDDATPEDNESYPPVFLNSLNPSGMPLHKLKL